jgi:hypothetical protein
MPLLPLRGYSVSGIYVCNLQKRDLYKIFFLFNLLLKICKKWSYKTQKNFMLVLANVIENLHKMFFFYRDVTPIKRKRVLRSKYCI